ncbi:nucleolar protein 10 [Leptopilina boulardi]|uniref:nucleolar protein 10 n=1 Tax=Leptopilina boulardi TaxID=63433 RepID=UPI0021F5DE0A|nr:nucleolar protein 10 [Leptopilina boulardi]
MQVSNQNNVKIYNLSAGRSLPEWLSDRKKRSLAKKHVDIRRRIELIQDFDMPVVSTSVRTSNDGQYVFATGTYKPRVKCFDVNNLSLKFERCFDAEVVTFEILSDDYSKLVFLQDDRNIEIHSAAGKYFRLRVPRFGRDMKYHYPSCDLFVVGDSNEIYRLNLERGQFLQSYSSEASSINKCVINPVHYLLFTGTEEGKVDAWDPRTRNKTGTLDCGFYCVSQDTSLKSVPSVTALNCQGGLTIAVGTATGQILLYDIRSNKPFSTKDHNYGLPIKNIEFHKNMDLVYSMDSSIVRIWEKNNGNLLTAVEANSYFNDLCIVPNTGMFFIANEDAKIQTYYIPSLGPAPKWCGFLDNLTEELEEDTQEIVYDDYKFITEKELDELGLSHLKGSNLLRAYMHGFYMHTSLYKKARDLLQPFDLEEHKRKKIKQKIAEERASKIHLEKTLPAVNKDLALKYMDMDKTKKKKPVENIMKDDRFKELFTNPDFQIDTNAEEYILLNPVISHAEKRKRKKNEEEEKMKEAAIQEEEEADDKTSADEDFEESSSDDEKVWSKEVQKKYRMLKRKRQREEKNKEENSDEEQEEKDSKKSKLFEIKETVQFNGSRLQIRKTNKSSLGRRLQEEDSNSKVTGFGGNRQMSFTIDKRKQQKRTNDRQTINRREYKGLLRPAHNIGKRKFK